MFCCQFDSNLVLSLWTNLEDIQNQTIFNHILMIINQNIPAILRALLNLKKNLMKSSTSNKLPQLLLLNFLEKFLTERKYLINSFIFVRQKYL